MANERGNEIRAIRVGSLTVNLHNVGYLEVVEGVNDDNEPVKALWVHFIGGRNVQLYSGDAKTTMDLYEYINVCMGQFLDLIYITEPKKESKQ